MKRRVVPLSVVLAFALVVNADIAFNKDGTCKITPKK